MQRITLLHEATSEKSYQSRIVNEFEIDWLDKWCQWNNLRCELKELAGNKSLLHEKIQGLKSKQTDFSKCLADSKDDLDRSYFEGEIEYNSSQLIPLLVLLKKCEKEEAEKKELLCKKELAEKEAKIRLENEKKRWHEAQLKKIEMPSWLQKESPPKVIQNAPQKNPTQVKLPALPIKPPVSRPLSSPLMFIKPTEKVQATPPPVSLPAKPPVTRPLSLPPVQSQSKPVSSPAPKLFFKPLVVETPLFYPLSKPSVPFGSKPTALLPLKSKRYYPEAYRSPSEALELFKKGLRS